MANRASLSRSPSFSAGYQLSVGYVPGSFLGIAFIAGLVAVAGVGRARRSGLPRPCSLPTLCGLSVLLAADLFHFSWRYQLPALVLARWQARSPSPRSTGWGTELVTAPLRYAPLPDAPGSPSDAS